MVILKSNIYYSLKTFSNEKNSIFYVGPFFCLVNINASQRTASDAQQIAFNYLNVVNSSTGKQKAPSSTNQLQLAYTVTENNASDETGLLYVFNIGNNNGYIIVSGNDKANDILGYSYTGTFNANKIPDGLNYWLNGFAEEIKLIENNADAISIEETNTNEGLKKTQASTQFLPAVSPLLGSVKWDQGNPYNNLCPVIPNTTERTVTGCVATGMAQVMKYHQWPVQGVGSNSYSTKTHNISLSENFSATTYDWANMTSTYNSTSTSEQKLAVATLIYHCGVASNMDYGKSSSATTRKMATALIENFNYDPNLNMVYRDYYTREEWINLLKTELNASRPILYSGQASTGGHLFVCDGYDSNDFFHFNWGWSGMSDGYYAISALNPLSQGIGSSTGGYNSSQDIIVGMQKPNPTTVPFYSIHMREPISSSNQSVARDGSTTITLKYTYNYGVNTFKGNIGLGLYDGNNLVAVIKNFSASLLPNYGYSSSNISNITIPGNIANGTYKLHTIYKGSGESDWTKVRACVGTPNFLYVQVSETEVTYTTATDYGPNLSLNSISCTGNVYQDKTGRFVVEVTNTGEEYNSKLGVYLRSKTNPTVRELFSEDVNIATNETVTFYINKKVTLNPGEYYLSAMYDPNNIRANANSLIALGNSQIINIVATPTDPPVFKLTSTISFPNNNDVNKKYDVLSADIINTGGYFENDMIAFIFPISGGNSLTYIGYQKSIFDTNEEKTMTFGGSINLDPGKYMIIPYYKNSSSWTRLDPIEKARIGFTINTEYSSIDFIPEEIKELHLFPNPAVDYISFNSDEIVDEICIYQIDGKLIKKYSPHINGTIRIDISCLNNGNYLLQANTSSGKIQISQFIKR